ncbi:MAG: hypothetical protein L3K08_04505 [Thermoplasmata archaeon]|nr:hypothetical protein [Thermoplasmata archaeon]
MAGDNGRRPSPLRYRGRPWGAGLVVGILGGFLLLLLTVPTNAIPAASTSTIGGFTTICNPKNPSPSALYISATNPTHAAAGDLLNVSYEYRVVNYTKADKGVELLFPSVVVVFPYLSAGSLLIYFGPKNAVIANSLWSDAATLKVTTKLVSTAVFDPNASAHLSTSKLAVMATTPTGSMTLEVRWHWTLYHTQSGSKVTGPWTKPSLNASSPNLPSTFYPAAYVGIVSTSGSSVATNTTYVVQLNGSVSSTWFRVVLEYPNNGTEIQSIYENTTANSTLFNATLPVAFRSGTGIPAGSYLIHVHDSCQAIVHLLKVTVT